LAGFEQPRFLHVEPSVPVVDARLAAGDLIRGQALVGRALVAVVLLAVGSAAEQDAGVVAAFGWAVALLWLPGVGLLDLAERRWGVRHLDVASLAWDVALFAAADAMLEVPSTAAVGYLLVTAFHAYVGGTRRAVAAAILCSVAAVAVPLSTSQSIEWHRLPIELLGLSLLAWLLADASQRQDTSRAGLVLVSEKSAAILAGIADAVAVMSARGRVQECNPAAARAFGCSTGADHGVRCNDGLGLHIGLRPLHCDEGCALLAEAAPGQSVEVWRRDATGRRQPLLASASAVVDERGAPIEVIHSFRDITALKAADEAKTLFLATTSHELKTPLTVIHGFAQMLQREELPAPQRDHALQAIEARSRQLAGIVDRLLMTSRIDAGRIDLELRLLDLRGVLEERATAFQAAADRPVEVTVNGMPAVVHADHDAVVTVLDHLLDNAAKYSPDGGTIRMSLASTPEVDWMTLSVADDGIGMSAEQLEHCFERFWQAETTDARRFGGTGIGLYIVRSLVEAMGGTISVHSIAGKGSTFDIRLRATVPVAVAVDEPPEPDDHPATGEGQSSMIREYMRQVGVPLQGAGGRS
jgi:signal transduction histidine kinase